jgi:hypothetical protein
MKATMTPCKPIEEIAVPSPEWVWSTNWKVTKMAGGTDAEGWEYASKVSRFKAKDRAPKSEARWSTARRRLWTRIMRREPVVKLSDITKALPKVQSGLNSIHAARIKIEQIMRQAPEAASSDQMLSLVASVERNIADILTVMNKVEEHQSQVGSGKAAANSGISPAALKKLRNDVLKEQAAIEAALEGGLQPTAPSSVGIGSGRGGNANMLQHERLGSSFSIAARQPTNVYAGSGGVLGSSFESSNISGANPNTSNAGNRGSFAGNDPISNGVEGTSSKIRQELQGINIVLNQNKGAVKSGSAGAFNPAIFGSGGKNGGKDLDDGDFVDRTTQELMIEQRLIPVDESTVMQDILDDRHTEIEKIHQGLTEINEMFTDLSRMVKEQESEIGEIYGNTEESHLKTREAFSNVIEANRLHQAGNCIIS